MSQLGFFVTGGALQVDAGCYVARKADTELLEALRRGDFCYVLTTRQMGKSSLMVRTAAQLREEGCAVVIIDLTAIGQNLDVEQWYFSMLCNVGEKLDLENEMETFWDANQRRAPLHRFMGAIREVYLERKRKPLVIFVDEIDAVRSLRQFSADEFFAGIRECFNRRPEDAKLQRLTFCLLGVATPSDLISDQRITPFNIGHAIQLGDFTDADAAVLAGGLSPHRDTARILLARVLWWTSGQPFLTQKLCAEVAKADASTSQNVDAACARIFLSADARERDDNLHFVRDRLLRSEQDRAALLDTYAKVCRGGRMADDQLNPVVNELRLSGIVRVVDGHLQPRNRIYSRVFDLKWVRANLPDAEARRQRAAFYRGVRQVAGVAVIVLAIMGWLVLKAQRSADAERLASFEAKVAGQKAQRSADAEKVASQKATEAARDREAAAKRAEASAEGMRKADEGRLMEAEKTKVALDRLVETQSKVEALLEALTPLVGDKSGKLILERAEAVVRGVSVDAAADDPRVVLGLAGLHRVCGRLYLRLGNHETARKQAEEAWQLIEAERKRGAADDPALKKQLLDCLLLVGDAILRGRTPDPAKPRTDTDYAGAIAAYRQALELSKAESLIHADDAAWRGLYFANLINLGDTARLFSPGKDKDAEARYREDAEARYRDALKAVDEFRKLTPDAADLNGIEASIHDRLGALLLGMDRITDARAEFDRSLDIRKSGAGEGLAEDAERQSDLAASYFKLGTFFFGQRHWKEALDYYEPSLAIRSKLCEQTKRLDWQRDLGVSMYQTADSLWKLGQSQRALDLSLDRLTLAEKLRVENPDDGNIRIDYAKALYFYADLLLNVKEEDLRNWPKALELAQHAVDNTERRDPRLLALLAQALRFAKRAPEAMKVAEEAGKLMLPEEKRTPEEKLVADEIAWETKQAKAQLKRR